ncbi:hypothetical protein ACFXGA_24630 [Actinosynnema sp. NPDC059335]|uniref:hypothetical protein n=1 Tax=Actinosynnema sp. NPDC059335 TaxID=3346804 RepID=UPI003670627C
MSELRRTAPPAERPERVFLWLADDLVPRTAPGVPTRERIHVPLLQRDRRRLFEGDEHVHGPSSPRRRHAARQGHVRARRERHLGTGARHAALRARSRGRGRGQL